MQKVRQRVQRVPALFRGANQRTISHAMSIRDNSPDAAQGQIQMNRPLNLMLVLPLIALCFLGLCCDVIGGLFYLLAAGLERAVKWLEEVQ